MDGKCATKRRRNITEKLRSEHCVYGSLGLSSFVELGIADGLATELYAGQVT
jgi:hypothetical protein